MHRMRIHIYVCNVIIIDRLLKDMKRPGPSHPIPISHLIFMFRIWKGRRSEASPSITKSPLHGPLPLDPWPFFPLARLLHTRPYHTIYNVQSWRSLYRPMVLSLSFYLGLQLTCPELNQKFYADMKIRYACI